MFDIVSIFCKRDLYAQILQARSISLYFDKKDISSVICVYNDTDFTIEYESELRRAIGENITLKLMTYEQFFIDSSIVIFNGWTSQQAIKLLCSQIVTCDKYIVLDAKNHFIRPVSYSDFVLSNGKIKAYISDIEKAWDFDGFQYSNRYFGI